jgi:hypothetical protein
VRIERDVARHIDRAVELINRTNQLNFTKLRLPEDPEAARAELLELLQSHVVQAGLVEVFDNYGHYGYVGFYLTRTGATRATLIHYCFSCRILNMGVEIWLYQALGRPDLRIRGTPPSDPQNAEVVDWVTPVTEAARDTDTVAASQTQRSTVSARGGCVLMPLIHYFTMNASNVVGEYNTMRDGISIRLDHSLCFRHALVFHPTQWKRLRRWASCRRIFNPASSSTPAPRHSGFSATGPILVCRSISTGKPRSASPTARQRPTATSPAPLPRRKPIWKNTSFSTIISVNGK